MEVKLINLTADDGKEYTAVAFRDTAASGDAQEQIDAAYAERDAALEAKAQAEETAANAIAEKEAAVAECTEKHFSTIKTGDGSETFSVNVPFEPDFISVFSYNPVTASTSKAVMCIALDLMALSRDVGLLTVCDTSTGVVKQYALGLRYTGVFGDVDETHGPRYTRLEDGTIIFSNLPYSAKNATGAIFRKDREYVVLAQKYTTKSKKTLIEEFIESLRGKTLTLSLGKKIIVECYPGADVINAETGESENSEWNELLSRVQNCTITLE